MTVSHLTERQVRRYGSYNKKPARSPWRWFWRFVITCVVIGATMSMGVFWYFAKDLPSADALSGRHVIESTKIYDRTGEHLLYDIHGEEKRTVISFEEIPSVVRYATIVLEDQDFYNHHGIKITSIVRAALSHVSPRFGRSSGGSTITQQLIKNTLLTNEYSLTRKVREAILALELERKYDKDEILAMYLNEIPYGSNAYGIEAAAKTFFNKHARELTLDEATLLASLPQQPSRYSPYNPHGTERLITRQRFALDMMAERGYISKEEAEAAKSVDVLQKIQPTTEQISAPHFVMYIRDYLEQKYGREAVEQSGYKVYTTLDWDQQQRAERVIRDGADQRLTMYRASNAALVSINPKNGQIMAMVGSLDFFNTKIDGQVNVALRWRQPGSSFKPYVYLEGFTRGYIPDTILFDTPTKFDGGDKPYEPKNYDGTFRGPVKIKDALAMSLNIPAVKMLYLVGSEHAIELAHDLGVTGLKDPKRYGLSLVLGGGEVTLLNHTHAYATLANGGVKQDLTGILRIEDKAGTVVEEYKKTDGERVVEEKYVGMLDAVLSENKYRIPVFGENSALRFDDRPVAVKTGTTNESRDAWTMGYTPSVAVGVWVGNNDNSPMTTSASMVAAPIWKAFMQETLKDTVIEHFPAAEDVDVTQTTDPKKKEEEDLSKKRILLDGILPKEEEAKVCQKSKKDNQWCLASDACKSSEKKRRKFVDVHDILYYVHKEDPRGDAPENPEKDPQFAAWESGVRAWYDAQDKYVMGPVPTDKCDKSDL